MSANPVEFWGNPNDDTATKISVMFTHSPKEYAKTLNLGASAFQVGASAMPFLTLEIFSEEPSSAKKKINDGCVLCPHILVYKSPATCLHRTPPLRKSARFPCPPLLFSPFNQARRINHHPGAPKYHARRRRRRPAG